MNQLTMEDVERMLGRLVMGQYQQEQQMAAYIQQLEEELAKYRESSDTVNSTDEARVG
jgi:hypothetical protein